MSDKSSVRCKANWGTQALFLVWMAGVLVAAPTSQHLSFKRWMQATFWPVYITWVEVGAYFKKIDDATVNRDRTT